MATLMGFKIPMQHGVPADHTYVTSDDGRVWGCWGRSAGGTQIASGTGSSTEANCISQTDSHAGLIYGVTGVCHQTANRILFPVRALVSKARGYGLSVAIYGTYGSDGFAWPARVASCTHAAGSAGGGRLLSAQPSAEERYVDRVMLLYASPPTSPGQLLAAAAGGRAADPARHHLATELSLLSDVRLGSEERVRPVHESQARALDAKQALDQRLLSGEIDGETYAHEVNALAARFSEDSAAELGPDDAERLYDHPAGAPVMLIEPEIAAEVYGRNRRGARG